MVSVSYTHLDVYKRQGLYGAELWEINKRNKSIIRAIEIDYWQRCYGLTRADRVKYVEIRQAMGIDLDIIEITDARRLNWFGHLKRISDERWPRKV